MEEELPKETNKKDKFSRKKAAIGRSKGKPTVPKKNRKSPQKPLLTNVIWIVTLALVTTVITTRDGTRVWKELRQKLLLLERSDPNSMTSSLQKKKRRRKDKSKYLMKWMLS